MESKAYPNFDYETNHLPNRDLQKWMKSARELYYQVHKGANQQQTFDKITDGWPKLEVLDFKNWLHFYQEGAQNKYKEAQVKTAQYWNEAAPGYYLPTQPIQPQKQMEEMKNPATHPDMLAEEKRQRIERQRAKIIGRLDSAEKLLRSQEGQELTGREHEQLIDTLYTLKKKVQMVNKISASVRLYQDMIIREANVMVSKGYKSASGFLTKMAQELPSVQEAPNPAQIGEGQAGTLPGQAPGQVEPPSGDIPIDLQMPDKLPGVPDNAVPPSAAIPSEAISPGMQEFLEGLDSAGKSFDKDEADADGEFIAEAQMNMQPPEGDLEVEEKPQMQDPEVAAGRDFDKLLDQTFDNITVADVISKLEDVSKIFKTREIPRQLAVIDMMLDHLGLAPFFSELSEASQKSLESNNYMQTRIESVLAKLHGTVSTKALDLKNDNAPAPNPAAQQLQQMDDKDKAKKQMRKEVEDQKLMKPTPTIDMNQDLSQPAELQTPVPAAAPIPAPIR